MTAPKKKFLNAADNMFIQMKNPCDPETVTAHHTD